MSDVGGNNGNLRSIASGFASILSPPRLPEVAFNSFASFPKFIVYRAPLGLGFDAYAFAAFNSFASFRSFIVYGAPFGIGFAAFNSFASFHKFIIYGVPLGLGFSFFVTLDSIDIRHSAFIAILLAGCQGYEIWHDPQACESVDDGHFIFF
jgi:hypothetical protein